MLKSLLATISQLVYPPHKNQLQICKKFDFSQKCIQLGPYAIETNRPPFCVKCSRHLGKTPADCICSTCLKFKPNFDFALSALLYKGSLKHLIHKYKYHQKTYLRHPFGSIMKDFINEYNIDIAQFDMLIPIPLHATRLRERGYNQATLLAEHISKEYNIKIYTNILKRVKYTLAQTDLPRKQRWTNIDGAFKIVPSIDIENKNILLIDDVLTTGATASQASLNLKSAGAKKVGVVTLAIAPAHTNIL